MSSGVVASSGTLVTVAPAAGDPEDVAAAARDCQAVGAAVAVLPAADAGWTAEALAALREDSDLLVQTPVGGLDAGPDLVSLPLDLPAGLLAELHGELVRRGTPAAYTATTEAQLTALAALLDGGGPPAGGVVAVTLLLGAPGGLPATLPALAGCLPLLPPGAVVSATGLGAGALPVLLAALSAGVHVRAGCADTPDDADGPARGDLQLVARAAGLARIAQRPPLAPAAARSLLGAPLIDLTGTDAVPTNRSVEAL
ncbi:3-keto-5-aminohexanoate cleavage protein [Blastococcus sp. SYSU D00820]